MNDVRHFHETEPQDDDLVVVDRMPIAAPKPAPARRRLRGGLLLGTAVLLVMIGALGMGARRYYAQQQDVLATAEQRRDFVPNVRVATVKAADGTRAVNLPGTTTAFAAANLFARASGYIEKRYVDIGDHVKADQVLAQITAPELDHQIAQAEATLGQNKATVQQTQANRDLADVTNKRDSKLVKQGWVTLQQGDTDRLNLSAQQAAVAVAEANVKAQEAQLRVLRQQKDYQRVAAPFDGVITQRNIDVGSLVTADAVSATFLFTIMQSDVLRVQVYVPQDEAFGLGPGVEAIVRVPEIPDKTFPAKVTRIADALQPGSRTLLTEIDVPNPDGILSPGAYCTVELHIPRKTPSLLVPSDAVVFDSSGLHVAVVENGAARMRTITVARDLGTQVEVRDGVKPGDKVILSPPIDLADGGKVKAPATMEAARN